MCVHNICVALHFSKLKFITAHFYHSFAHRLIFFASIRSRNEYFSHTATRMRTIYRIHYPPDFHKLRAVREYADFVGAVA